MLKFEEHWSRASPLSRWDYFLTGRDCKNWPQISPTSVCMPLCSPIKIWSLFSLPLWIWALYVLLWTTDWSKSDDAGVLSVGLKWPCSFCFHPLETLRTLNEEAQASWVEDEKNVVSEAQPRAVTINPTCEWVMLDRPALAELPNGSSLDSVLWKMGRRKNESNSILVEESTFADVKLRVG